MRFEPVLYYNNGVKKINYCNLGTHIVYIIHVTNQIKKIINYSKVILYARIPRLQNFNVCMFLTRWSSIALEKFFLSSNNSYEIELQ